MDWLTKARSYCKRHTDTLWGGVLLTWVFPYVAIAGSTTDEAQVGTLIDLIRRLSVIVNPLIALLTGFAVLAFVRGIAVFIWQAENEEKRAEGKKFMIWGIVGLFVILSFWGAIQLISGLYFGTDTPIGSPFNPPI